MSKFHVLEWDGYDPRVYQSLEDLIETKLTDNPKAVRKLLALLLTRLYNAGEISLDDITLSADLEENWHIYDGEE